MQTECSAERNAAFMRCLFVLFAASLFAAPAQGQTHWVAKTGNDSNSCTTSVAPCLTIQGAVNKVPLGTTATISIAPGIYNDPVNIFYHRVISISGPLGQNGECTDKGAVTLSRSTPGPIIWVQDHPIVSVSCVTLSAPPGVAGISGISTRQFAILDYGMIRFGAMPGGGAHVSAGEMSKVNCNSDNEIVGGAAMHASAGNLSSLYLGCNIAVMLPGLSFATIVMANVKSAVDASLAVFTGYGVTGKKYIVYDSNLILPSTSTIPGIDFEVGDGAVVRQERFSQYTSTLF
jgi:hypothetical protein